MIVPLADVRSVIVVVASVLVPTTVRVLLAVRDDVAVIDPPVIVPLVKVSKNAVTERSKVAKKVDDVAFVKVDDADTKLVIVVVANVDTPVAVRVVSDVVAN